MPTQLKDKIVLITGSSRGLGKTLAKRFLQHGSRIIITSQNPAELDKTEIELKQISEHVLKIVADIRDENQVHDLVIKAIAEYGRIDILINNAGVFKSGEIDQFSIDDFNLTFDINIKGAFLATKHVVAQMKNQRSGQIINICSIGAKLGLEKLSAYCASKAALALLGDSLKAELKPYHIRVTNIFPHAMNTQGIAIDPVSSKRFQMIEPDDVADAIITVASSNDYVQYQDITIYPFSTKFTKSEE